MARISSSQTFFSVTQIWVWWKRLKQQPKPQSANEKKDCIGDFWHKLKLQSSFLMTVFHSFLKYLYAADKDKQW